MHVVGCLCARACVLGVCLCNRARACVWLCLCVYVLACLRVFVYVFGCFKFARMFVLLGVYSRVCVCVCDCMVVYVCVCVCVCMGACLFMGAVAWFGVCLRACVFDCLLVCLFE